MTSKHPTVAGAAEAQGSMTRQQMLDFFKHREDAYDDLDAAALAADYADHAVIESPTAGVHTGPEAAERTFRVIFGAFLDLTTKVESLIIDGNSAVTVVSTRRHAHRRVPGAGADRKAVHHAGRLLLPVGERQDRARAPDLRFHRAARPDRCSEGQARIAHL